MTKKQSRENAVPVNLLNERNLNDWLTDIVYQGEEALRFLTESGKSLQAGFKSADYVEQNKDSIIKGMINQYVKHRLRAYLMSEEEKPFLRQIQKEESLPGWAEKALAEGRTVYEFIPLEIPSELREEITLVRDFLYNSAEKYVDKCIRLAKDEVKADNHETPYIKLRWDYLKSNNEYADFSETLSLAKKYHEKMARTAKNKKKDQELYDKSLSGTETELDFGDGMRVVRLTTPEALDYESDIMGHCVGDGTYDKGVENGKIQIYSLRDKNDEPHATIEVKEGDLYQCKGKGNKVPATRYRPYIQEFIRQQEFELTSDGKFAGLIKQNGCYYDIYNLPKGFVVEGNLNVSNLGIEELPDFSHVIVKGNFICKNNRLHTLKGAPPVVGGKFDCSGNKLVDLEGAPQKIGGEFDCSYNQLIKLKGAPSEIKGSFYCYNNQLKDL